MFFHQRFIPGLAIASYLIGDEKTKEAVVIDPTRDVDELLHTAAGQGLHIRHVLETHVHADFVSGSVELKARLGDDVQIHCSGLGGPDWSPAYADRLVKDGDQVRIGNIRLAVIYTPGHTPEHISWALYDDGRSKEVPWLLFTGDFLFVGDVGRPDLLGDDHRRVLAHQLFQSVFDRLAPMPDFTEIFPAHGAGSLCGKAIGSRRSSTLGFERRFNASLKPMAEADWAAKLLKDMPLAPSYFRHMKQINAKGPPVIGTDLPGKRGVTARQLHDRVSDNCLVLDVRPKESFAAAHIPGSINIPQGASFSTWAGWVLPYDRPILIVPADSADVPEVVTHLLRVGLDDVQGFLEDGIEAWENLGYALSHLQTISVHELAAQLKDHSTGDEKPFVLDVRTDGEWNSGQLDSAHHIHGGLLQQRLEEVPRDREIAIICGTGYRGSIAASFLKRQGHERVTNVAGGMTAWAAAKLGALVG